MFYFKSLFSSFKRELASLCNKKGYRNIYLHHAASYNFWHTAPNTEGIHMRQSKTNYSISILNIWTGRQNAGEAKSLQSLYKTYKWYSRKFCNKTPAGYLIFQITLWSYQINTFSQITWESSFTFWKRVRETPGVKSREFPGNPPYILCSMLSR